MLKVQDQIAASLVRALQVTVSTDELGLRPILKSPEAYDLCCEDDMHSTALTRMAWKALRCTFSRHWKLILRL